MKTCVITGLIFAILAFSGEAQHGAGTALLAAATLGMAGFGLVYFFTQHRR